MTLLHHLERHQGLPPGPPAPVHHGPWPDPTHRAALAILSLTAASWWGPAHTRCARADPTTGPGLSVQLSAVGKSYGPRAVLQGIDLCIAAGEFVAIVGRSGSGKSTLLRLVAGLEAATRGRLHIDGQPLQERRADGGDDPCDDRHLLRQGAPLQPWQTVADLVAQGLPGPEAAARAPQVLALVGLADRAQDRAATLCAGQRQRVALARALVRRPRLLLLDEPLGALDARSRSELQPRIEQRWRQQGFTALLVTHDVAEAVALADRVLLLEDGRIALDERIPRARPRTSGHPRLQAIESRIRHRMRSVASSPSPEPPVVPAAAMAPPTEIFRIPV